MSQEKRILSYLRRRPLTSIQALNLFGCLRLAARVNSLRDKGHDINSKMVERGGKLVAQYRLAK